MNVAVLGGGVIGLCSAICLQKAGHIVTIYAKNFAPKVSSNAAGAVWLPLLVGDQEYITKDYTKQLAKWAKKTWDVLLKIQGEKSGIRPVTSYEIFPKITRPLPFLLDIFKDFKEGKDDFLPGGNIYKWSFTTFLIEPDKYMNFLMKNFLKNGGVIVEKIFNSKKDISLIKENLVFNCLGLGSNVICEDKNLIGVKGQLLLHEPVELDYAIGAGEFVILPRSDALVLGSLFQRSFETEEATSENDNLLWSTISKWTTVPGGKIGIPEHILSKNKIIGNLAAIRPYRINGVRLNYEKIENYDFIHNYGHGGSGLTLSWGCAEECVMMLKDLI